MIKINIFGQRWNGEQFEWKKNEIKAIWNDDAVKSKKLHGKNTGIK